MSRWLASLRDACISRALHPVVSSLRSSTTGYTIPSLRDGGAESSQALRLIAVIGKIAEHLHESRHSMKASALDSIPVPI